MDLAITSHYLAVLKGVLFVLVDYSWKESISSFKGILTLHHEWSSTNKMPFNTAKCEVIAFNSRGNLLPSYKIGEHSLNYVDEIKYLGVVMQSNRHIASKVNSAKTVLRCIKYALNDAPQPAKLLAYSSLCQPILELSMHMFYEIQPTQLQCKNLRQYKTEQ